MNRSEYKKSMSGIRPSNDVVERIMDMTYDKKSDKTTIVKSLVSATLALAVLVGGGFGTNTIIKNNKANQPITVMVAYADEFMKVKSGTKQTIHRGLYYAPINDEQKLKEQYAKAQKDYDAIDNERQSADGGFSAEGIGNFDLYVGDTVTAKLYTTGAGYLVADVKDYSNVKTFTVQNESDDGILQFEWSGTSDLMANEKKEDVNPNNPYSIFRNNKFTLSGDELRSSDYNKYGYVLYWYPSTALEDKIAKNPNMDVTSIKDKITFTFEYNNKSVHSTSVNISFDSDGHMQLS